MVRLADENGMAKEISQTLLVLSSDPRAMLPCESFLAGRGWTVIVTGDPNVIIDGKQAARHGDKTACGATLLSSQGNTGSI